MSASAPDPKYSFVPLADQIEAAERELHYRYGLYAKRVSEQRMTQEAADAGIAAMRAVRDTLRTIQEHEDDVRAAIMFARQRKRDRAAVKALRQEMAGHPTVAAVCDALDAEVGMLSASDDITPEQPPFDFPINPDQETVAA